MEWGDGVMGCPNLKVAVRSRGIANASVTILKGYSSPSYSKGFVCPDAVSTVKSARISQYHRVVIATIR